MTLTVSPRLFLRFLVAFGLVLAVCPTSMAQSFEPDSATKKYLELWRTGKYEEALAYLEEEIERSIDGVPITWLQDRAMLMFELGRVLDAVAHLEWLHQRRPTPENTLKLALLYQQTGNKLRARQILEAIQERFKRATRYEDDTDNDLALHRIREMLGDNPRELFKVILSYLPREKPRDHVKRHVAAGDLAFRKWDWALAADQYEKALALDGEHVDALAGLADCFWHSGDPELEPTLEKVLAINPIHPRARAIRIEQELDAKRPQKAMSLIDEILDVNPASIRFLGYKAAAMFLLDKPRQTTDALTDALMYNPRASQAYRITARIASRHYRFAESVVFLEEALTLDPDDHLARAQYAFDLLRLGRDKEGRRQLELAFEKDRFNVQVYNMLELMDTLEKFSVIETSNFILKMPVAETRIWSDAVVDVMNKAHAFFEDRYKITLEKPTMLQIFDNHDDFMVRSVGLPGNVGHLGICFGRLITMDSPTARNKWGMNWRSVLWHEFVHVITLQKTDNRMSRWLSEGISVFEETVHDPTWAQRLDPAFKIIAMEDDLPGIGDMEALFTQARTQAHLMFGYYASAEFVSFYVETYGLDKLLRSLDLIREGAATHHALLLAAGTDDDKAEEAMVVIRAGGDPLLAVRKATDNIEEDLNRRFHQRLKEKMKPLDNLPSPPDPDAPRTVAPSIMISPFTDALERAGRAVSEKNWDKAEKEFKTAIELFPEYVGPDSPIKGLANLYKEWGKRDKYKETLHQGLALDPTDFAGCMALAELYREERDWERMLDVARRAMDIDPFDIGMNRVLAEALQKSGKDGALAVLDRLLVLDPHHAIDYRLERIDLLIPKDKNRARGETLALLEEIPWSWEAQSRLLKIVDGDQP